MTSTFTQRLKERRDEHGLTQFDMAHYLNVGQSTYARYEIGDNPIPAHKLERVCARLDLDFDEMAALGGVITDDMALFLRLPHVAALLNLMREFKMTEEQAEAIEGYLRKQQG